MAHEWRKVKIEDIASVKSGKRLPKGHSLINTKTQHPYIRLVDIVNGQIQSNNLQYLTANVQEKISRYIVRTNDVCLAIVGHTIGMVFYVNEEWDNVNLTENAARITGLSKAFNPRFLYYYLTSPAGQNEIINRTVGSAQGKLPLYNIKAMEVPAPVRSEQDQITKILDTLDSKIQLNRQTNQTLEAMAQALFKSWFVDFDPVIDNALAAGHEIPPELQARAEARKSLQARAEQRQASLSGDRSEQESGDILPESIRQLFPNRFVLDAQMGWIPEGWESTVVGQAFDVTMGQSPPGSTYNEEGEGLPFFQGKADFGFRFPTNRVYCTAPKRFASKGQTLISVRAPVGTANMAALDCCIGRGVAAVRHKSGSNSFTYYAMIQLASLFEKFNGEGTVFGSINQKDFNALAHLEPTSVIVSAFNNIAKPIDDRIEITSCNANELARTRDTLLPKLISGELRLPDEQQPAKTVTA